MKAIHRIIAALGPAFVLTAPADAGINDPEVIIYRFAGVQDDGGAIFTGTATVFFCTNFSGATENVRFVTREHDTTIKNNTAFPVDHLQTVRAATHPPSTYGIDISLATSSVSGGTTAIAATSTNIICTAVTIDAANAKPDGVALRGVRFNPAPGSQE